MIASKDLETTHRYRSQARCCSPRRSTLGARFHIPQISRTFFTCILCCEKQFGAVVGVRPNAELAGLRVKGELVEPHRADEGDVGGLAVQHVLVRVDPQARQLRQHVDHFVGFQVVDKNVRQPQVLDKLQVHGDHHLLRGVIAGSEGGAKGGEHVQPALPPLHVEVGGEGDAVVLVVDPQHLVNVNGHFYRVCLFCG